MPEKITANNASHRWADDEIPITRRLALWRAWWQSVPQIVKVVAVAFIGFLLVRAGGVLLLRLLFTGAAVLVGVIVAMMIAMLLLIRGKK